MLRICPPRKCRINMAIWLLWKSKFVLQPWGWRFFPKISFSPGVIIGPKVGEILLDFVMVVLFFLINMWWISGTKIKKCYIC